MSTVQETTLVENQLFNRWVGVNELVNPAETSIQTTREYSQEAPIQEAPIMCKALSMQSPQKPKLLSFDNSLELREVKTLNKHLLESLPYLNLSQKQRDLKLSSIGLSTNSQIYCSW